MTLLNNILLWLSIVFCGGALIKDFYLSKQKLNQPKIKEKQYSSNTVISSEYADRIYNIILILAAAAALFIRIYKFGSVPGGFNQDGAMAAVDAKALADYGTDRYGMHLPVHLTAWGYGQMSALLSYLMVPFVKIGGLNPITARLPQLIVSLAGLVFLYLFIRDVFGKKTALIVGIFAAINPWHILQSRWALDCNLYPHFFIMGIYFLNKGLEKRLHLVISMIMFGLCMYCYGISIYTMPLFLIAACAYLLITKRLKITDALIASGVYLLVAWPFIAVMAVNFLKLDTISTPLFTIPFFPNSVRSNDILFFSDNFGKQLVSNIKSLLNVTLLQKKDLPWNDIAGFGTMYLFSMPFVITGIIALFKNYRKSAGAVFALMFLLTGIWSGLITASVNVNRINIVYYPIIIMAGIGIAYAAHAFGRFPSKYIVAAAYTVVFVLFSSTYFTSYADGIAGMFFKNFGDAVTYVKNEKVDKFYITADSQREGSSNVSEILTLFYHDIDAEYYQGKKSVSGSLPFSKKYTFSSIKKLKINDDENAAYVITEADRQYFDENKYIFKNFGGYCAVTPKR